MRVKCLAQKTQCNDPARPGLDFEPLDPRVQHDRIVLLTTSVANSNHLNTFNSGYKAGPCSKPGQFRFP